MWGFGGMGKALWWIQSGKVVMTTSARIHMKTMGRKVLILELHWPFRPKCLAQYIILYRASYQSQPCVYKRHVH